MIKESFATPFSKQIIRRKEVETITGLSRSSIYREIAANRFPKPIKLTPNGTSVGWLVKDIYEWIEQRINDSRAA
ncbi:helix-turn-helix transcriptional regulator [Nitrincola nitratireducens]|uniref:Putative transcriptional regulator n=1 Tax=Nitrincola nitratireducens TaxID=1229521 RepID=W9UWT4_9GAMM|nr:AlpA family phage regulatory protein [Nitrincola nitratireducens]EXJ09196.1 putative transcriptional regulator [Nitrincola nitratireducens]